MWKCKEEMKLQNENISKDVKIYLNMLNMLKLVILCWNMLKFDKICWNMFLETFIAWSSTLYKTQHST